MRRKAQLMWAAVWRGNFNEHHHGDILYVGQTKEQVRMQFGDFGGWTFKQIRKVGWRIERVKLSLVPAHGEE